MGGPVSLEVARLLPGRARQGTRRVLVDTLHDVSQRRSIESARADAEHLSAEFAGYFAAKIPSARLGSIEVRAMMMLR